VSDRVAFRLLLPGVVVTWFVTGFPDPGKVDDSRAVPLAATLFAHDPATSVFTSMIHAPTCIIEVRPTRGNSP
jgi:hypothetical protein